MARKKRRHKSKTQNFYRTAFPRHHERVDEESRRLAGRAGHRKLLALANRLLNELPIEQQPEPHTVIDDRVEPEMIGRGKGLRPLWHSKGRP